MSLLTDLKHWFGEWQLKRSVLELKRNRAVFNLKTAQKICVLFNATDPKNIITVNELVKVLSPGKDLVSAMGFVNEQDKSFEHMSTLHFDFFSNEDLNWYGKPQGMIIDNFLKEEYDILIDLTLTKFYPLTYMVVASPAKFKVGRYRADVGVFDLSIDNSKNQSLEALIKETTHYLNRIQPI
jgi:hypothetical protein